jgi:hypothetical protein
MEREREDQGEILRFTQDDGRVQNDGRERAVLNRIPKIKKDPGRYWRQVFFICEEYHEFATAGQNDPNGDEKFLALSRESPGLRIQTERGRSVITSGPYQIVRHPGYFAMLVAVPASALAVGSWLALLPAFAFSAVIVRRTALEDRYLRQVVPGYLSYAESVRYRLLPGIWQPAERSGA